MRTKATLTVTLGAVSALSLNAGCQKAETAPDKAEPTAAQRGGYIEAPEETGKKSGQLAEAIQEELREDAEAELQPAEGEDVEGEVVFFSTDRGVRLVGEADGLSPGDHGVQLHERGDCSDVEGKSMGGHFVPEDLAYRKGDPHQLGNLGNVEVSDEGKTEFAFMLQRASLDPDDRLSILGKSIVIYEKEAAIMTKEAGDLGTPLACGVIEAD